MALELVTGYQGQDHVTAEQWADFNRGIYGDAAILPVGSEMAVDIQTANQITVKDGIGVFDGREVYIGYGETENIAIASGTQGMLRNDIVVIKYTKQEETGVESVAFEVVEGTPAASNQTDPAYADQDIRTGVFTSQKPFCRVRINGTAIEGVDMLVDVKEIKDHAFKKLANNFASTDPDQAAAAPTVKQLKEDVDELNSALFKIYRYGYYKVPLVSAKSSRDIAYNDILNALQISAEELIAIEASLFDASVSGWDVNIKNQPTDNRLRIQNDNDAAQDVYINLLIFYR